MRRLLAAALVSTVLFAACGAEDEPDVAGGEPATVGAEATSNGGATEGPCTLVSNDVMSGLLSIAVTGVSVNPTLCEYAPDEGAPGSEVLAADLFANKAFDAQCSLEFDNTGRGVPVDGIGDEAFWKGNETGSISTAQLLFCTGDKFWTVTLYVPPDRTEDMLAVARSVAETALAAR